MKIDVKIQTSVYVGEFGHTVITNYDINRNNTKT